MLAGENGIITQANNAKLETRGGEVEERVSNWKSENKSSEYSPIEVKSESDFIQELKEQKLVYDNEIDKENKIIKIGSKEIYYGIGENDITALKFLVNSGEDGIIVLPIAKEDCNEIGYQVDWGDGTTGIDDTVIANKDTKLASRELYLAAGLKSGIPHTYQEKNKDYEVTITGKCEDIWVHYGNTTKEKIIEVLQWGETGLKSIYLSESSNLRKIASPTINSFNDLYEDGLEEAFKGCTSLTEIPLDLFSNCPQVTSFKWTFYDCESLITIPQNLFDNCLKVKSFAMTFDNCTSLTGYVPKLWTKGTNTEGNSYQGIPDGYNCFCGCTGLSNYDIIPDYWKDALG